MFPGAVLNHQGAICVYVCIATVTAGLTKLMWRHLELSYTFLSRGEGNARL